MSETHETSVRRILVVIDTSPHGSAAFAAASRLAAELRAELHGLFVEDINLLRLAGLPFAREIDFLSGASRPLNLAAMEHALRTRAEGFRQAIAETAQRTSVHWSFRVSRGSIAQTMVNEAFEADLLLVGREQGTSRRARPSERRGPIMFIDEDPGSTDRVLKTAQRLVGRNGDDIVALVTHKQPLTADRFSAVSPHSSPLCVQRCAANVEAILQAVGNWNPQLLLIDRSSQLLSESAINALITLLPCPLALVQ